MISAARRWADYAVAATTGGSLAALTTRARVAILIRDILRRRNCLPDLCQRGRSRQRVRLRSESLPILPRRRFYRQPTNFCLSASRIQYFPAGQPWWCAAAGGPVTVRDDRVFPCDVAYLAVTLNYVVGAVEHVTGLRQSGADSAVPAEAGTPQRGNATGGVCQASARSRGAAGAKDIAAAGV